MKSFLVLAGIAFASLSNAALLWDYGITTGTYGGSWANQTAGQNFAERVVFGSNVSVDQYIYLTNFNPAGFGTMHVKVHADTGTAPGALITAQDVAVASSSVAGVLNGNTIYQAVLNLAPINLAAGSYWFGASGNGFEAAQLSLNPGPGNNQMAQFSGPNFGGHTSVGDQAFQLYGTVPEPTTLLVLGGLSALALRKRRKA
jgi:hypothetical protein